MPALAAWAPAGATKPMTGTGEASTSAMISRMLVASPPGVLRRRMTASTCCGLAVRRVSLTYLAVAGPMAPVTAIEVT